MPWVACLTKEEIDEFYTIKGMTDKEIASVAGVHRTAIVKLRTKHGIKTRDSTGKKAERIAISKLRSLGFKVIDMNVENKLSSFDLLINDNVRVDIKSAQICSDFRHLFTLTEKRSNGNIVSPNRITFDSGRTRKLFRNTCDILLLVGLSGKETVFYLIPSSEINDKVQTIAIPSLYVNRYRVYENRWDFLMEKI